MFQQFCHGIYFRAVSSMVNSFELVLKFAIHHEAYLAMFRSVWAVYCHQVTLFSPQVCSVQYQVNF